MIVRSQSRGSMSQEDDGRRGMARLEITMLCVCTNCGKGEGEDEGLGCVVRETPLNQTTIYLATVFTM